LQVTATTTMTTMTIGRTSVLVKFVARTMLAVTVVAVASVVFELVFPGLATATRGGREGPLVAIHF